MTKFVWIDTLTIAGGDGGRVPVNPDRVTHLRRTNEGHVGIVFGAFAGGFDQIIAAGTPEAVVAALEGAPAPAAKTPRVHKPRPAKTP